MSVYQEGHEFKVTIVVCDIDQDDQGNVYYSLKVKEMDELLDGCFQEDYILEIFDPEIKRKRLLAEKERIENELKELEEM